MNCRLTGDSNISGEPLTWGGLYTIAWFRQVHSGIQNAHSFSFRIPRFVNRRLDSHVAQGKPYLNRLYEGFQLLHVLGLSKCLANEWTQRAQKVHPLFLRMLRFRATCESVWKTRMVGGCAGLEGSRDVSVVFCSAFFSGFTTPRNEYRTSTRKPSQKEINFSICSDPHPTLNVLVLPAILSLTNQFSVTMCDLDVLTVQHPWSDGCPPFWFEMSENGKAMTSQ